MIHHQAILHLVPQSILLGIFATSIMDLSNLLGKHLRVHQGSSYSLIGRWIGGFFKGRFSHSNIIETPAQSNEIVVGLVSHYCIGIVLAFLYLCLGYFLGLKTEHLGWSVGYGTLTNVLPWFIMFPAFGFGILALRGPHKNQLLRTSFFNHLGYGLALGLGEFLRLNYHFMA